MHACMTGNIWFRAHFAFQGFNWRFHQLSQIVKYFEFSERIHVFQFCISYGWRQRYKPFSRVNGKLLVKTFFFLVDVSGQFRNCLVLFWWTDNRTGLLRRGKNNPLTDGDIFDCPPNFRVSFVTQKFHYYWDKETRKL